jgi:hypothetical protein
VSALVLLVLAASPASASAPAAAEPEDREPPLVFYFEAEGSKRVGVELDKPFNPIELGKSATLRVEPHRRFAYAGFEFKYPREYGFEAQLEAQFSAWTLSGNDTKLIVQRYRGQKKVEVMHKGVLAEIHKAYGGKAKESPVTMVVGGRTLEGTRLEVELASARVVQDLFPVKSGNDVVELIIQDSPKKAGEPSAERVRTQKLLEETLKLPK